MDLRWPQHSLNHWLRAMQAVGSFFGSSIHGRPVLGMSWALPCLLSLLLSARSSIGHEPIAAHTEQWWAFRSLPRPEETKQFTVDDFIFPKMRERGLGFAPIADRRTLCRRLHLDLIGLPPAPSQVDQFVNDPSPEAVEALVDRLLDSPHYGERWGRQWLDIVGYADSNGYIRHDSPRPLAYRYRDYVIQSLNDDLPYDQFWKEQLAGDELVQNPQAERLTADELRALIATHYLRNPPDGTDNTEGNEITRVMERYAVLEALLQTTMSAMFGLTIDCARCHDHKFDPIPQRDYYALQAIFYPAFNVREWMQPKDRWMHGAGQADVAAWRNSVATTDRTIAELRETHQSWIAAHRPPGDVRWSEDFSGTSLKEAWSATAPGDMPPASIAGTKLDATDAPAAKIVDGRLSLFAAGAGDSRWLSTQRRFDWTPEAIGDWTQVTFDLVASRGANGQPAERVGYYIALHDYDDDSSVSGGNILFDGNPAGGANVVLDYPGSDQKGLGKIGKTGYLPGRNFGMRISKAGSNEFLLQHLVDGELEPNTLTLSADQLPDGGFGFELCCSRNFTVDNVRMESSDKSTGDPARERMQQEFAIELNQRQMQLTTAISTLEKQRIAEPEKIAWATDLSERPPQVPLLKRGDYFQPGDAVAPGPLTALSETDFAYRPESSGRTTGRRLAFAQWATRPGSPAAVLLARVQVDRMWRGHFGKGLVPTPENFGRSGVAPTHPELLDWLAAELVANGWRQKAVHRQIVLSNVYRQSSEPSAVAFEQDPDNECYSRFPSHRLEAESIRDSMLAVAGVLNPRRGGPAVDFVDDGSRQIVLKSPVGNGPHDVDRRSIYLRSRRSQPLTFLRTFDQASPDPNCVMRGNSAVVAQSLALLNGAFVVRMGREFARQVRGEPAAGVHSATDVNDGSITAADDYNTLIARAFERAFSRSPSPDEFQQCRRFLEAQCRQRGGDDAARSQSFCVLCQTLLASNEFLYVP